MPRPDILERRSLRPLAFGAFALAFASHAQAQSSTGGADLDAPLPNVLLLVDTSGSMEYKVDGTETTCGTNSQKSRWIDLLEVMTGEIENYRCETVSRTNRDRNDPGGFLWDYARPSWGASYPNPSDYLYPTPYHRPLSVGSDARGCAILPRSLPASPYEFLETAIRYRFRAPAVSATPEDGNQCSFNQRQNGILDAYGDLIRFGLMTFDAETDPRTGVSGSTVNYGEGMQGGWSYRVGNVPMANPAGCNDPPGGGGLPFDPGARNAAAPPWEGRMVAFGDPGRTSTEFKDKRKQIENVLLMTRPYGATPIAGLLKDASDFLLKDESKDPLDRSASPRDFGPYNDPYVKGGCRKQSIILLTDGRPNLDLRPFCSDPGSPAGICPFDKPEEIVGGKPGKDGLIQKGIDTFVIPFAISTFTVGGQTRDCAQLSASEFDDTPSSLCGNPANQENEALQACCVLNRIAVAGAAPEKRQYYPNGQPRPFFAANRNELASALSSVLSSTLNVTSRTQPVISSGSVGNHGMRFFSFVQPRPLASWIGSIRRQRWTCDGGAAKEIPISVEQGDDFAANLEKGRDARHFETIKGLSGTNFHSSTKSLRPHLTSSSDGLGTYGIERISASTSGFAAAVSPEMASITDTTCSDLGSGRAEECRDRLLKWLVGAPNGTTNSRCDTRGCSLLGDALHASPVVVGPPQAVLRDETYAAFSVAKSGRPIVLYAATNDGFLHAFRVGTLKTGTDVSDSEKALGHENNELWAFVPPAVLPSLKDLYPFNHLPLLDTTPVVKDVIATEDPISHTFTLERGQAEARNAATTFRTVLVQSVGRGYYALDVTDPVLATTTEPETAGEPPGPRFLWQVTTDTDGNPLFGTRGVPPLITTLYFDPSGGANPREIAVAVLPGGGADPGSAGAEGNGCAATAPTGYTPIAASGPPVTVRPRVRCYPDTNQKLGRSLTVVRLDTGEIIRTFRQSASELENTDLQRLVTPTPLESPITGQPVAFPAEVGAVADRAYVGDQDGRVWRVDFSNTDPTKWKMQLFFDTFPSVVGEEALGNTWNSGQPITSPPVISVDTVGNVTLNVATGDQELLGPDSNMTNYVWSLKERLAEDRLTLSREVNWYQPLSGGERVVGPLTLFNSQLFFTTYTPAAAAAVCANGSTRIWGMDYLRPKGPGINEGGNPRLVVDNDPNPEQFLDAATVTKDENAVVFGVSVAQQPSCDSANPDQAAGVSPFFANGGDQKVRNINPGRFELVMHKGGSSGLNLGGSVEKNVAVMPLQTPPSASRIDSWAALLE